MQSSGIQCLATEKRNCLLIAHSLICSLGEQQNSALPQTKDCARLK